MISVSTPQDSKDGQDKGGMGNQAVQPVPTPTRSTSGVPQTGDDVHLVAPPAETCSTETGATPAPDDVPTVPESKATVPHDDTEKAEGHENNRKAGHDYDQISFHICSYKGQRAFLLTYNPIIP